MCSLSAKLSGLSAQSSSVLLTCSDKDGERSKVDGTAAWHERAANIRRGLRARISELRDTRAAAHRLEAVLGRAEIVPAANASGRMGFVGR